MCGQSDNQGTHVLVLAESNLSKVSSGFTYGFVTVYVPRKDGTMVETQKVVWHDEQEGSGDEILARAESGEMAGAVKIGPREIAINLLNATLQNGPRLRSDLEKLASAFDISLATLIRAKKALNIISEKQKVTGCSMWSLPAAEAK